MAGFYLSLLGLGFRVSGVEFKVLSGTFGVMQCSLTVDMVLGLTYFVDIVLGLTYFVNIVLCQHEFQDNVSVKFSVGTLPLVHDLSKEPSTS